MHFLYFLFALIFSVNAQRTAVGSPLDQSILVAGEDTVVEIDRPNFLSSAQEVSVVIGIQSCTTAPCLPPSDIMGRILFSGEFHPQFDEADTRKPPHQNYTVTIPANLPKGRAQIGIVHLSLIGAGLAPFLETRNVSVTIQ